MAHGRLLCGVLRSVLRASCTWAFVAMSGVLRGSGLIKTIRLSLSISDTPTRSLDDCHTSADIPLIARVVGEHPFITSCRHQSALISD